MCSYVLMRLLESSAKRYDAGISLLTLGNEKEVKSEIASKFISKNDQILEIGIGTGTLAILCAKKGAVVTGIDISSRILKVSEKKIQEIGLAEKIKLMEMGVVEMDKYFPNCSFDKVISTFVFSEMSEAEQRFALKEAHRVLRSDGEIIVLDDVVPRKLEKRVLYQLVRIPLAMLTYLLTQTTTNPLEKMEEKLREAHFRVETTSLYFLDSLKLIVASKEETKT